MSLFNSRNDLAADWAAFIGRVNQVEEERRDPQSEPGVRQLRAGVFFRRECRHQALELFDVGDALPQLPAPIVPF